MSAVVGKPARPGWRDVLRSLSQPKVGIMLMLGFSSGLPFMLVGNTMGFWLREHGIELSAIGFLSWVGLAYSLKFLWAPLIDKADVPLLGRLLGHRRGWMLFAQLLIGAALAGMALITPLHGLMAFAAFALVAAFGSATQDIVIDAWRIESADKTGELALLTSAYQLGYRSALLLTEALILVMAARIGWPASYLVMASMMLVGILATLLAREPLASLRGQHTPLRSLRGVYDAVAGPFIEFFRQHGRWALLMLVAISLYRMPDFVMGPMANPFYADLHIPKETVGEVRAAFGLFATLAGIAAAGLFAVRFGTIRTLLVGGIIGPGSILAFAWLAHRGGDPTAFAATMVIDNFSQGFAGVALIGYMSSLTNVGYTATQYALLSSFYALPGKLLKGFSGVVVEQLSASHSLYDAYALFFTGTALLGIPAFVLCLVLANQSRRATALALQATPTRAAAGVEP